MMNCICLNQRGGGSRLAGVSRGDGCHLNDVVHLIHSVSFPLSKSDVMTKSDHSKAHLDRTSSFPHHLMLNHLRTIFSAAPLMMHRFNGPTLPTATNASHTLATASSTETAIFANGWSVPSRLSALGVHPENDQLMR